MRGGIDGAIGGAASAALSPLILGAIDPNHDPLTTGRTAALGAFATLVGGLSAGLAGANAQAGAQAGQNVALNNDAPHWGQPASQTGAGLLGQQTGSNGSSTLNPFSDPAAVACAGGTQSCDTQLFQTLAEARASNAALAQPTINAIIGYGAPAMALGVLSPAALVGGTLGFAFDYGGDLFNHVAFGTDSPNFQKSYFVGAFQAAATPLLINEVANLGLAGKIGAAAYNGAVGATASYGGAAMADPKGASLSAQVGGGTSALGTFAKGYLPPRIGEFVNQIVQAFGGPVQGYIQKNTAPNANGGSK